MQPRTSTRRPQPSPNTTDRLSEEILIEVLSYLTLNELSIISRVSPRLNRLSEDPQLWKTIYRLRWGDDRLKYPFLPAIDQRTRPPRPSSALLGADTRGKGREQAMAEEAQLGHTWKNLCRISLNWQTGSAQITRLIPTSDESQKTKAHHSSIIVRFHRSLLFTASRATSAGVPPVVTVYQLQRDQQEQSSTPELVGHITSTLDFSDLGMVGISEIRVDEGCDAESVMDQLPFSSRNSVLLVVFYTTGQFAFFQIGLPPSSGTLEELDVTELYASTEVLMRSSPDGIYHQAVEVARFYYPLLVTCSTDFLLRFYALRSVGDAELKVRKLRLDMRSQTCFWPLSINLSALDPATTHFRITIAYPTPFYPSAWTVGLQEFEVAVCPSPRLLSNRHATALPANTKLGHHSVCPVSFNPVSGIEYAEPNTLVVARTDNTLDIFEYHRRPSQPPELIHRRTLFGHTSRVAAVAVNSSGRCVSAGQDGLNVWELAEGSQTSGPVRVGLGCTEGRRAVAWVGFDTEKIVGVLRAGTWSGGKEEDGQVIEEEVRVLSFA